MVWIKKGRVVWKYGDHFDSDLICGVEAIRETDPEKLAKICMASFDPEFPKKVRKGDLVVAGRNFGYGHPHLNGLIALQTLGISAIIAESFARPFFRSAIHTGFPVLPCKEISKKVKKGDELEVNFRTGEVKNLTTGESIKTQPLAELQMQILQAGGLVPYLKQRLRANMNV